MEHAEKRKRHLGRLEITLLIFRRTSDKTLIQLSTPNGWLIYIESGSIMFKADPCFRQPEAMLCFTIN